MKRNLAAVLLASGLALSLTACGTDTVEPVPLANDASVTTEGADCDLGDRFEHDTDCLEVDWLNADGTQYRPGIDPVEGVPEDESEGFAIKFKSKVKPLSSLSKTTTGKTSTSKASTPAPRRSTASTTKSGGTKSSGTKTQKAPKSTRAKK